MSAYVDMAYVKLVGAMPPTDIDALETLYAGTFAGVAEAVSRMFDARLAKRYATPFASPYPRRSGGTSLRWLWPSSSRNVDYNPGSAQDQIITQNKADALAWLKEAADSKDGLVELPIREDIETTGVIKGGPLGYAETSPYVWTDTQATNGRNDDQSGSGS